MAIKLTLQQIRFLIFSFIIVCILALVATSRTTPTAQEVWEYAEKFGLSHSHDNVTEASNSSSHDVAAKAHSDLAYMTFLAGTLANDEDEDLSHHRYFMATRILGYRLMHDPNTKTQRDIPFVVVCTPDVTEKKKDRLRKDGATVITVDYLRTESGWIRNGVGEQAWLDVMSKLRAWQLTQYKRVLFMDGDMIINKRMDEIFDEPTAQMVKPATASDSFDYEPQMKEPYLLATIPETNVHHAFPPSKDEDFGNPEYFNAGFFMFAPSDEMFNYYHRLMETEHSFDPKYPEQNLLNQAHRRNGMVPWQHLSTTWNIRFPYMSDLEGGAASLHDKWWDTHVDDKLQPYYDSLRWKMEGFYEGWDLFKGY